MCFFFYLTAFRHLNKIEPTKVAGDIKTSRHLCLNDENSSRYLLFLRYSFDDMKKAREYLHRTLTELGKY